MPIRIRRPDGPPKPPQPTTTTPKPPPTTTTTPAPGAATFPLPAGTIQTRGPKGQALGEWKAIRRWQSIFERECAAQSAPFHPLLLMCFAVIESGGNHYRTGQMTGTREEVVVAPAGSIGLLQIMPYHARAGEDLYDPATNIRVGVRLLTRWMGELGPWEAALAQRWHPGTDPHSGYTPQTYIETVRKLIAEAKAVWPTTTTSAPTGYREWEVAGSSKPLRLPNGLPFRQQLTTVQPNRTHRALQWTGVTQHTTNNDNIGAGAAMHANWQANGTPGHPNGKVSVHFYVDDKEVVQCLPIDEQGIHSGDWRNQQHVAVELCTNADRNVTRAEANAVAVQAALLHILGASAVDAMYPHTDGGHCPRLSVAWREWERRVDAARQRL